MKKSDHISICESGINSIQIIGDKIYGCTSKEIIVVNKENSVDRIAYDHEEIYKLQTDGVRVYGKDMYGGTYSINENEISKLNEQIIDFHNKEIRRVKRDGRYFLMKFEKELFDFGNNKIVDYLIKDNIVIVIQWIDNTNSHIVAADFETNREIWRTKSKERVQQLIGLIDSSIYISGYDGKLYQIDIGTGSYLKTFIDKQGLKVTNIPRAKIDRNNKQLVHPEIEIDLQSETLVSRKLERDILDNGRESIEHYFQATDYTFNNEHIYFQIHSYPDIHNKNNTSKIVQIGRNESNVLSKFYINPANKSIDAKQILLLDKHIIILDVHGKLLKKKIKYET
ncbi:hypothetical protein [uncultured Dokdonia sp.]|uniref:hypothetical protein n=1 Tax=uncultured Dokdonia sp. TaxID=575653 RepID=UPI0030EF01D2|tara:strand:- start:184 stop:1200 length:1017 start_codon:yes stop_codon:yes gene_type:complete